MLVDVVLGVKVVMTGRSVVNTSVLVVSVIVRE
jgi:hypothetical protein